MSAMQNKGREVASLSPPDRGGEGSRERGAMKHTGRGEINR